MQFNDSTRDGGPQRICVDALRDKYCVDGETEVVDVQRRVARALASLERSPTHWEPLFLSAQQRGVIMGGRVNSAAGTQRESTWINCFVQPVADSISHSDADGRPGIYVALQEATETMRRGGGVGYDFSRLRPRGALVRTTQSEASGPVSYMRVFDRSCETVESAGARRGAQMGVLRIDHPDVLEFVHAKSTPGELVNFNMSVAVTNDFMRALEADGDCELVHAVGPAPRLAPGAYQRNDGMWVYRRVNARALWDEVMRSTYDHGEPGIVFIDRVNEDNNLYYCERIEATNPCAEQPLPPYGCCCLGSIDLTRCVSEPFTSAARFDFARLGELTAIAVRMLDNVLDGTPWPLAKQRDEARAKRRIGLGFLGLGDALVMLGVRYDAEAGRGLAQSIAATMRDHAYRASIDLAAEKGAFPLFDQRFVESRFVQRLPSEIRDDIRARGIRNSHLLSIAPTGTISLAFADNASNGIEPAYAWSYRRRKRRQDGAFEEFTVEDHAHRRFRAVHPGAELPDAFVSALEISALDHARMVAAVQPFIDSGISKTVNVPADYPFAEFRDLYRIAWQLGAKSLATFRPNTITGSILRVGESDAADAPDRRIQIAAPSVAALTSLRWPRRPVFVDGNPAHCYMVKHPHGQKFALFVGHFEEAGAAHPFEVWVNGIEQPRGLNALAINLSYDMYARDRGWLLHKLDALNECVADDEGFELPMPPNGEPRHVPSLVAAMATLIRYRCEQLGAFARIDTTPVLDALMSRIEPRTGADGTLSWTVDVANPATGDEFILGLKELQLQHGATIQRRPYAIWLSGVYPKALDGLCKALSLDMRVIDPAWIAKKLRELLTYAEPKGDFFAPVPDRGRQQVYPSTVAYMAALVLHRYTMLGVLDEAGFPVEPMGLVRDPTQESLAANGPIVNVRGRRCDECGAAALIRVDGCDRCSVCGAIGVCG